MVRRFKLTVGERTVDSVHKIHVSESTKRPASPEVTPELSGGRMKANDMVSGFTVGNASGFVLEPEGAVGGGEVPPRLPPPFCATAGNAVRSAATDVHASTYGTRRANEVVQDPKQAGPVLQPPGEKIADSDDRHHGAQIVIPTLLRSRVFRCSSTGAQSVLALWPYAGPSVAVSDGTFSITDPSGVTA